MRLDFVLPPGWSFVPLQPEQARDRALDAMVAGVRLDDGQGAEIRRQLREQLQASTVDALAAGASVLALSTGGPGGVPIPASLLVTFVPGVTSPEADEPWLADEDARVDRATVAVGDVVRRVRRTSTAYGAEALPTLAVDYWVSAPDGGLAHLALSTPLVDFEEAMVGLFDAIVETARWSAASQEVGQP